jgi:hypothetical protein
MNILDHQYFIDTQHKNKLCEDGGGATSRDDRPASESKGFYTLPQENQVGVILTDDFGKFATRLMSGEAVITYSDGRVEHKSVGERITLLIPSIESRAPRNETILSTGFNAHSIRTPDGTTIEVLENGEINITEAKGESVKIRPSNTIQNTHIK